MTGSSSRDRRAWPLGVLASAVGAVVASYLARLLSGPLGIAVGEAIGPVAAEVAIGALVVGGMTLGVAPGLWLAARSRVAWAGVLLWGLPVGGCAAGAVGLGLWAAMGGVAGGVAAAVTGSFAGLGAFAVVQWAVARRHTARAGRWAAASLASLFAAFLATFVFGVALAGLGDAAGQGLGGAAFGAAYTAVAGGVLRRMGSRALGSVDPPRS